MDPKNVEKKVCTVKLVFNDHPLDPKIVAVFVRWSLFRGTVLVKKFKMGLKNGGRYVTGGCYSGVVVSSRLTVCAKALCKESLF